MKLLLLSWISLCGLIGSALASEQSVLVAKCEFKGSQQPKLCTSEARLCIDGPLATTETCSQTFTLQCDGKDTFSGTWTPGYQDDPKTLFISGNRSQHDPSPPWIQIKPGADRDHNSSILELANTSLEGNCFTAFDSFKIMTKE